MGTPDQQSISASLPPAGAVGALPEGSLLLDAIFQVTSAGLVVIDAEGKLLRMNAAMGRMIGLTPESAGLAPAERLAAIRLTTPDGRPYQPSQLPGLRALRGETVLEEPVRVVLHDGRAASLAISAGPIRDARGAITGAVLRFLDTTGQSAAEEALRRANRARAMLSRCDEALLRSTSEEGLCKAICRAVVEEGGYLLAWVGVPEDDAAKSIRVVAHAGRDEGYLETANLTWAGAASTLGPAALALRDGRLMLNLDIEREPLMAPWRERALAHGLRAVTVLPLVRSGQPLGVLVMYAGQARAPETTELRVLAQMADDVAFGVASLRAARRQEQDAALLAAKRAAPAAPGREHPGRHLGARPRHATLHLRQPLDLAAARPLG